MAASGIHLDKPQIYGKQTRLFYVEWNPVSEGEDVTLTGFGWGDAVQRPHQGTVKKVAGFLDSEYLVTLPGNGRPWTMIEILGCHVVDTNQVWRPIPYIDLDEGTVDLIFVPGLATDDGGSAPMPSSKVQLTLLCSDWQYFA